MNALFESEALEASGSGAFGTHVEPVAEAIDHAEVDLVDDVAQFFAPTSSDAVDQLLGEYQMQRRRIDQLAALMGDELGGVVHYFIEGNAGDDRTHRSLYVERLFRVEGAVHALNAAYWSKALALTNVYDAMPQDRRNTWNEQLRNPAGVHRHGKWEVMPLKEFIEDAVRPTLANLLAMRSQFLAERVDGIFRNLSGEHVTNVPEGFGRRLIIGHLVDSYGGTNYGRIGYINDLRCVIAKFMGRDEPKHNVSCDVVENARRYQRGEWVTLDGGALRVKAFKCGTAHLEVHPDMAWRLNAVLAHLHPLAIPAQFRMRPKRAGKAFAPLSRPLPFRVVAMLSNMRAVSERMGTGWPARYRQVPNALSFNSVDRDEVVAEEAGRVLEAIGGTPVRHYWQFDYPAAQVIAEIAASGCIPDAKSHQFYPTPEDLARRVVDLAEVGQGETVLEPSAGTGNLAKLLPKERTTCVELSELHCAVLRAQGLATEQADFLVWGAGALTAGRRWDRVVMNPPFSEGRWHAHVGVAAELVKPGGRLVAVLPSGARTRTQLPRDFAVEWQGPIEGAFAGANVSVVVMVATRRRA